MQAIILVEGRVSITLCLGSLLSSHQKTAGSEYFGEHCFLHILIPPGASSRVKLEMDLTPIVRGFQSKKGNMGKGTKHLLMATGD